MITLSEFQHLDNYKLRFDNVQSAIALIEKQKKYSQETQKEICISLIEASKSKHFHVFERLLAQVIFTLDLLERYKNTYLDYMDLDLYENPNLKEEERVSRQMRHVRYSPVAPLVKEHNFYILQAFIKELVNGKSVSWNSVIKLAKSTKLDIAKRINFRNEELKDWYDKEFNRSLDDDGQKEILMSYLKKHYDMNKLPSYSTLTNAKNTASDKPHFLYWNNFFVKNMYEEIRNQMS